MKIKKNGKVINLTESDLKRIVKRTLTELKSLNESITVNDVKMSSSNSTYGGPVKTQYNDTTNLYSIVVDTAAYDGKVGIGTTSPTSPLTIKSNSTSSSSSGSISFNF